MAKTQNALAVYLHSKSGLFKTIFGQGDDYVGHG